MVSRDLALELGVKLEPRSSTLVGMAGSTSWIGATIPELRLGRFKLPEQQVAVGVKGIPTHVGLVPLDGILGNDVLKHFQVELDYPGQSITLHRPDTITHPDSVVPLFFDGQHPKVQVQLTARNAEGRTVHQPALLDIDTGATGLILMGPSTRGLKSVATSSTTSLSGVGSSSPVSVDSRAVPIVSAQFGGQRVERPVQARWLGADRASHRVAEQMPGLLGYDLLRDSKILIDYPAKRLAVVHSPAGVDAVDVHRWYIARGGAKTSDLERVRALFMLGEQDAGRQRLERVAGKRKAEPAAVAMLARIERREGSIDKAAQRLSHLSVRDLIDTGEIISSVNSLWLAGRSEEAVKQAKMATILQPESSIAWLALSDAQLAAGHTSEARRAMQTVIDIEANPSAHLLRRGIIAMIDGDQDGALAHLREHIRMVPHDGYGHWLYAQVARGPERRALASADLTAVSTDLNPQQLPMDFLAAAWRLLGDTSLSDELFEAGQERDCRRARTEASQQNCEAWYLAMRGQDLGDAATKVTSALEAHPGRAEFLDTLAVVRDASGDAEGAREASWEAARHSPDDVYLFTQAIRFQAALTAD